jgi:hypothetical protein
MHVQGNNGSPPTSNTGAIPIYSASAQSSRTKPTNSAIELAGYSSTLQNDNHLRRLDFDSAATEGSGEHEPREQELMDVPHHEHDVHSLQTMIENATRIKVESTELNAPSQAGEAIGEVFAEEPPPVHDEEGKDNGCAAILAADHALEIAEFDQKLTLLRKDADLTTFTDSVGQTEATPREELLQGLVKSDFAVKQEVAEEERGNGEQREEALGATPAALEIRNLSSETVWENTNQEDFDEDIGEGSTISSSEEESERSGSDSESDSEYEERVRQRRERRRDIAIRRAAKAAAAEAAWAAIRDREDLVAKLEKEKEALEHLLAEKEEEQVKDVKVFNSAHRTTQFWPQ